MEVVTTNHTFTKMCICWFYSLALNWNSLALSTWDRLRPIRTKSHQKEKKSFYWEKALF